MCERHFKIGGELRGEPLVAVQAPNRAPGNLIDPRGEVGRASRVFILHFTHFSCSPGGAAGEDGQEEEMEQDGNYF